jgi:hypothetical protein
MSAALPAARMAAATGTDVGARRRSARQGAADTERTSQDGEGATNITAPPWGCAPHPSTPGELALAPSS